MLVLHQEINCLQCMCTNANILHLSLPDTFFLDQWLQNVRQHFHFQVTLKVKALISTFSGLTPLHSYTAQLRPTQGLHVILIQDDYSLTG